MKQSKIIKTYKDWEGDLSDYLQVEDLVDNEMFEHFLNVLPPAFWSTRVLQIGSPYNHVDGKAIFPTLKKTSEGWAYAGHCFRGEIVHRGN